MAGICRSSNQCLRIGGVTNGRIFTKSTGADTLQAGPKNGGRRTRGHLEEQISDNLLEGMDRDEAVKRAVEDMGSPVETGISLDALHRPQMCWSMIILIGFISFLGIVIQTVIGKSDGTLGNSHIIRYIFHVVLALA